MAGIFGNDPEDQHFENQLVNQPEAERFETMFEFKGNLDDDDYISFLEELEAVAKRYNVYMI